jgi:D-ribose pyranose/furanose isomerase RbsD
MKKHQVVEFWTFLFDPSLGHNDILAIGDAGLPIPPGQRGLPHYMRTTFDAGTVLEPCQLSGL